MLDVVNERAVIGGNQPPSLLDFARETMADLSRYMSECPVIENEDHARQAKLLLDRYKNCAGDIEAERDRLVRPLNAQLEEINSRYKAVHNKDAKKPGLLDKVANELKSRLATFLQAEEDRRLAKAEAARRAAEEAERIAREAEAKERQAIENAKAGELGVDVTQVVVEADSAFADFKLANREAALAEREAHVKVGGGFGRAAALRDKETLILDDPFAAISAMGVNEKLETAILSAARDYRSKQGSLPAGVSAKTERTL